MPRKETILSYIGEFVRIARPAELTAFDVPAYVPPKHLLQPRRRLFTALRRAGIPTRALYKFLRAYPVPTTFTSTDEVTRSLQSRGARVLEVVGSTEPSGVRHAVYSATK